MKQVTGNHRAFFMFVPSIASIIFTVIFLHLSLYAGTSLLGDGDTGYHIRAGEYIIKNMTIPYYDIFSYRTPPLKWTAHEWLSEVIMALVHSVSGLTGVVVFFAVLIAATFSALFRMIRRLNGDMLLSILIIILAIRSSHIHWLARPHIFSLGLFTLWYYILDEHQYNNRNILALLPVLMLFWVNLHGGFILGLAMLGLYLIGNIAWSFWAQETSAALRNKARRLSLAGIGCLAASLLNPQGYSVLLFPFRLVSNRFLMDHVTEFLPPDFHGFLPFRYLFFFMIILFALSERKNNIIELMLVMLFSYMALYSARYIPLFAVITAPILQKTGNSLIRGWKGRIADFFRKRSSNITSVDRIAGGRIWIISATILTVLLVLTHKIEFNFDRKIKPIDAIDFLKKEHIKGNMFNNDEFGDVLIYEAWPEYRVFFDGRSDMYGAENMKEYFKIIGIEEGWEEVLDKYKINWIFFDSKSTLSQFLLQRSDWKLIYSDKVANIFVKNIPENRMLIEKYRNVKPVKDTTAAEKG